MYDARSAPPCTELIHWSWGGRGRGALLYLIDTFTFQTYESAASPSQSTAEQCPYVEDTYVLWSSSVCRGEDHRLHGRCFSCHETENKTKKMHDAIHFLKKCAGYIRTAKAWVRSGVVSEILKKHTHTNVGHAGARRIML